MSAPTEVIPVRRPGKSPMAFYAGYLDGYRLRAADWFGPLEFQEAYLEGYTLGRDDLRHRGQHTIPPKGQII